MVITTSSSRTNWYSAEEIQYLAPEISRWRIVTHPHAWRPPTDVYETENAFIVRVEIAGMRETDFTISLQERYLSVRGNRSDPPERRAFHQLEIPFGDFNVEIELPASINTENVEASYRDGFLRIALPKARPTHIHIGD